MQIDPAKTNVPGLHQLILGAVAPRPIALASTLDRHGKPNLSPFSFFNVFGVNPTTLIFSPSRRGRDNTTKHTYQNVKEVPEVVINVVTRDIVWQASLASTEYAEGVNEFLKSGLTMLPSVKVKPFRVKESPVQFECRVRQVIETGDQGGAGNLVICEILMMHVDDAVLDDRGLIDPDRIRLVGRMGDEHYCEAFGNAIFDVAKPLRKPGIGIDQLPVGVRLSKILTGNDLGRLANMENLPEEQELKDTMTMPEVKHILEAEQDAETELHRLAKKLIAEGRIREALCVAIIGADAD
jgi:flavin reductase (DIM6/NTAB) family NADH-FMN oxidoreductase RutF